MKDFRYVIENFFTHKDYLVPASQIPGTIYTPLQFAFVAVLLVIIIGSAIYVSKRKHLIKPVFTGLWITLVILEFLIVYWNSVSGKVVGFDPTVDLPLYPCSIIMYALPLIIWGKGAWKKMACGYACTLGFLGAAINFLYPVARLTTYSCISFPGFHTFFFHGSMLFIWLVMILSGYHRYTNVTHWWELFLPCVMSLIVSIPANIINYSPIKADYMYFRGEFPVLQTIFKGFSDVQITLILYVLYIFIPALFYLPSYISQKRKMEKMEAMEAMEAMEDIERVLVNI